MTISSQIRYYQFFVELTPALILGIIQVLRNTDGMGGVRFSEKPLRKCVRLKVIRFMRDRWGSNFQKKKGVT